MTLDLQLVLAIFVGVIAATVSMWVYWRWSPQEELCRLNVRAAEARTALYQFDGLELGTALQLTRQSVTLCLRQLRLMIGPSLLAAVPILGLAWLAPWTEVARSNAVTSLPANHVPLIGFWCSLCASTVFLRFHFKIR
jgi:hypothetical protein